MTYNTTIPYEVPKDWGQDPLSEFIETTRENTIATFANLAASVQPIARHSLFSIAISSKNLNNSPDWFSAFFVLRAHASYLGRVRFALSGQVFETYMVLRGCLENALYGFYFHRNPASQETWLRRSDDNKEQGPREERVYWWRASSLS